MTPSELPPPYTPRDPYEPPSPPRRTSPQLGDEPSRTSLSLRGGYLRPVLRESDSITSPTAFFEERNFESEQVPSLLVLDVDIHPGTKREDLSFPLSREDRDERNVTDQDWATFVNYLLTELGSDELAGETEKGRRWGNMTPEEFFQVKQKMESIVSEWNEAFFMPRGIHFNAKFSFAAPDPATSSRTVPAPEHAQPRAPPEHAAHELHDTSDLGPAPGYGPPGFPPMMRGRGRGMHWGGFMGRGFGPGRGRGGFGPGAMGPGAIGPGAMGPGAMGPGAMGPGAIGPGAMGPGGMFGRGHGPWHHPHELPGSGFGHPGYAHALNNHRGNGPHRRRSHSVSSNSSSSSDSSVSSLSGSSVSGADVDQVRQSIAAFRLDPTRKTHLKLAVRALHSDLRSKRQAARRSSGGCSKEAKAEYKENKKAVRSELRGLKDEVRSLKHNKKQARRLEKRAHKAERREAKGKRKADRRQSRGVTPSETLVDSRSGQERGIISPSVGRFTPPPEQDEASNAYAPPPGMPPYAPPPEMPPYASPPGMAPQSPSERGPKLHELSKADRKLEERARTLDFQADHWEHHARHWERQMDHYAHVYAQHDHFARTAEERHEAVRVDRTSSDPRKAEKAAEQRAKRAQKTQKAHDKRMAQADGTKLKLLAQKARSEETAAGYRRQAAETRAKMEYKGGDAGSDVAWHASREVPDGSGGPLSGNYWDHIGRGVGTWGEQFGRNMEAWGERFGKDMEAWGRDVEKWGEKQAR